jgi:hypothetical protein
MASIFSVREQAKHKSSMKLLGKTGLLADPEDGGEIL